MADVQPFLANALADHIFRGNAYPNPTDLLIALFNNATEVTGAGYSRVSCWGAAEWSVPVNGLVRNSNTITFPTAAADWGVVTHVGLFDQDGNLLIHRQLSAPRDVPNGETFEFDINNLAGLVL